MIELRKTFRKYGEEFTQLYKDNEIVIYQTTFPSVEVFKYMVDKPDNFHSEEWERYPSESHFGLWAWCCTCKEQFDRVLATHFRLSDEKCKICYSVVPF